MRVLSRASITLAGVLFVSSLALGTHAQDASREAALVLRILSYDRNLPQRASERVTVVVLFRDGDSASEAERQRIAGAINTLGRRTTVARMPAGAVDVAWESRAALAQAMRSHGAVAIYVCSGLDGQLADIRQTARDARALSMSADANAVRGGLGVGLIQDGARVRLLVNLAATEAEGARLDAALLGLAEVIR